MRGKILAKLAYVRAKGKASQDARGRPVNARGQRYNRKRYTRQRRGFAPRNDGILVRPSPLVLQA